VEIIAGRRKLVVDGGVGKDDGRKESK